MIHIKRQTELKAPLLYDTRNTLSNEPNSKVILLLLLSFYRNRSPKNGHGNLVIVLYPPSNHHHTQPIWGHIIRAHWINNNKQFLFAIGSCNCIRLIHIAEQQVKSREGKNPAVNFCMVKPHRVYSVWSKEC